jgi:predicted RNA-binding protein with PUA domain
LFHRTLVKVCRVRLLLCSLRIGRALLYGGAQQHEERVDVAAPVVLDAKREPQRERRALVAQHAHNGAGVIGQLVGAHLHHLVMRRVAHGDLQHFARA